MTKTRGRYSSPAQIERRDRILRHTQQILEAEGLDGINMSRIAKLSNVSTKTLYNIYSNRNALLLAATRLQVDDIESSSAPEDSEPGIPNIFALTQGVMSEFQKHPEYMETVIAITIQGSADDKLTNNQMDRIQRVCYQALRTASKNKELLPHTDCLELSQLLAAGQWGLVLLWQKHLISLEQLVRQSMLNHCVVLMPFCRKERREWLENEMRALPETGSDNEFAAAATRKAG